MLRSARQLVSTLCVATQGVLVDAGAKLVWTSDGAEVRPGFTVCAAETSSLFFLALCQPCLRFRFLNYAHPMLNSFLSALHTGDMGIVGAGTN